MTDALRAQALADLATFVRFIPYRADEPLLALWLVIRAELMGTSIVPGAPTARGARAEDAVNRGWLVTVAADGRTVYRLTPDGERRWDEFMERVALMEADPMAAFEFATNNGFAIARRVPQAVVAAETEAAVRRAIDAARARHAAG